MSFGEPCKAHATHHLYELKHCSLCAKQRAWAPRCSISSLACSLACSLASYLRKTHRSNESVCQEPPQGWEASIHVAAELTGLEANTLQPFEQLQWTNTSLVHMLNRLCTCATPCFFCDYIGAPCGTCSNIATLYAVADLV